MRKPLKIISLLLLIVVSFTVGVIVSAKFHIGSPLVTVNFKNASSQEISSVRLEHEQGVLSVSSIKPGESHKIYFYVSGESSYKLTVAFIDGHTITGGAGYVESGYSITESIANNEIKSKITP